MLICILSLSTHRRKQVEEIPKDTIDTIVYTHRDTLLFQCDTLLEWAKDEKMEMPNTTNYIRSMMESVDITDSTSTKDLNLIVTVLSGVDNLSPILSNVQQLNDIVHVTAEAIAVLDTLFNRDEVDRLSEEIKMLDTTILTNQQNTVLEEIRFQLNSYLLATSNFLDVIDDIEKAKSNASNFTNQINENVLLFENRNKNINCIPYMKRLYEELMGYLNQLPDGTFDVDKVQWGEIEIIKTAIINCRKK